MGLVLAVIVLIVLGSHEDIFKGPCKDPRTELMYSDIGDLV